MNGFSDEKLKLKRSEQVEKNVKKLQVQSSKRNNAKYLAEATALCDITIASALQ